MIFRWALIATISVMLVGCGASPLSVLQCGRRALTPDAPMTRAEAEHAAYLFTARQPIPGATRETTSGWVDDQYGLNLGHPAERVFLVRLEGDVMAAVKPQSGKVYPIY